MNKTIEQAVYEVARQAVEYLDELQGKPRFREQAKAVLHLARAIQIGREHNQADGWDIFETDKGWQVQADDRLNTLDDLQAQILARQHGIRLDDEGYVVDEDNRRVVL